MAAPGNPCDGPALKSAPAPARRLAGTPIDEALADKGCRGHGEARTGVRLAGQQRGIETQRPRKRRRAIEPMRGRLKTDRRPGRHCLKGTAGDRVKAPLSGAGHNLRRLLNKPRHFCLDNGTRPVARLRRWNRPRGVSWLPAPSMAD